MTLQDQINHDIKEAMKARNVDKLSALRAVKSNMILEATKEKKTVISDETVFKVIAKLVKQRKDAAAIFIKQNRQDLADEETRQLLHLEPYLPDQMGEEELRELVKLVINEIGASSFSDIGRCIGVIMQRVGSKAEGSTVSKLVKEELSS